MFIKKIINIYFFLFLGGGGVVGGCVIFLHIVVYFTFLAVFIGILFFSLHTGCQSDCSATTEVALFVSQEDESSVETLVTDGRGRKTVGDSEIH